jgi:hypothetical protein
MENLFVTYNKNSEIEENTALRLQTLSNLYGFSVFVTISFKFTKH